MHIKALELCFVDYESLIEAKNPDSLCMFWDLGSVMHHQRHTTNGIFHKHPALEPVESPMCLNTKKSSTAGKSVTKIRNRMFEEGYSYVTEVW